jgi:hypothetical protein
MVAIQEKVNAGMDANIEKMVACLWNETAMIRAGQEYGGTRN